MKTLKRVIVGKGDVSGYHFVQVFNEGRKYIYAQVDSKNHERVAGYEVFIANRNHSYPGNEDWGNTAWTVSTLDKAHTHLDSRG